MSIEKKFSFISANIIWRLLFSESNKLIIEERDPVKREVSFSCLDSLTGALLFKNLQLEEKFWIGIEVIYKDIIVFHKYGKPDMPGHKGIFTFSINSQKVLWHTDEFSFLLMHDDKMYVFKQKFDERIYFSLDYLNGMILSELGPDNALINNIRNGQDNADYSLNYQFPERYIKDNLNNPLVDFLLEEITNGMVIIGNIEYIINANLLFFNFYEKEKEAGLVNRFHIVNLETMQKTFEIFLNKNANAYVPDSFFLKDNQLYLLKEKNEILVYSIIK